jgi:hypothetical protein
MRRPHDALLVGIEGREARSESGGLVDIRWHAATVNLPVSGNVKS